MLFWTHYATLSHKCTTRIGPPYHWPRRAHNATVNKFFVFATKAKVAKFCEHLLATNPPLFKSAVGAQCHRPYTRPPFHDQPNVYLAQKLLRKFFGTDSSKLLVNKRVKSPYNGPRTQVIGANKLPTASYSIRAKCKHRRQTHTHTHTQLTLHLPFCANKSLYCSNWFCFSQILISARSTADKFKLVHRQMTKRANETVNIKLKIMAIEILVKRNNIIIRERTRKQTHAQRIRRQPHAPLAHQNPFQCFFAMFGRLP